MADRGRKSHPVTSQLLDERWMKHNHDLHMERLRVMKPMTDCSLPESTKHMPSHAKRKQLDKESQEKIDIENRILLDKLIRIKNFDSSKHIKPWLARSVFQYRPGAFYDPISGAKCLDHINATVGTSPRSIHSVLNRPDAPPTYKETQHYLHLLHENGKLLRTIEASASDYAVEKLGKEAAEHIVHSRRLSNYRGPEAARFTPVRPMSGEAAAATVLRQQQHRPESAQASFMGGLQPQQRMYTPLQRRTMSAGTSPSNTPSVRAGAGMTHPPPNYGWGEDVPTAPAPLSAAPPLDPVDEGQESAADLQPWTSSQTLRPLGARRPVPSAPSARAGSAHHHAQLAELGVVDEGLEEGGSEEEEEEDGKAAHTAAVMDGTPLPATGISRVGNDDSRPGSASSTTSRHSLQLNPRAIKLEPLTPSLTAKRPPSPTGSARSSHSVQSMRSVGSARSGGLPPPGPSPYLQPISRQQSQRSTSLAAELAREREPLPGSQPGSRPGSRQSSRGSTGRLADLRALSSAASQASGSGRSTPQAERSAASSVGSPVNVHAAAGQEEDTGVTTTQPEADVGSTEAPATPQGEEEAVADLGAKAEVVEVDAAEEAVTEAEEEAEADKEAEAAEEVEAEVTDAQWKLRQKRRLRQQKRLRQTRRLKQQQKRLRQMRRLRQQKRLWLRQQW
ncbi:hypothetical protein V8C86DRAFT_1506010 [Haematococcus lacustris]